MTFRIFVFSDSHRSLRNMYAAVDEHKPDLVIHLGDVMRDAEELSCAYPKQAIVMVPGNCDGWFNDPLQKRLEIHGKTLLFSHGHIWRVKSGYGEALAAARTAGADLVMFGHTHLACCTREPDGLWVLNPGCARYSYGVVTITDGEMHCEIVE